MARAGLKNRILYLQKPTRTIATASGEPTETWTNVGFVYAEVIPRTARETVESGQNSAKREYDIRVNYRNDINPQRRFLIDDFAGVLNGAINNSTTTIAVVDSAFTEFSQARRLRVLRVDDELMLITGVSGNNITVTRGQFGTSAASHDSGASAILYRQLNIESVNPDNRHADMVCRCIEVA